VPLTTYLKESAFDRPTIEAMTQAYYAACWSFDIGDRNNPSREIIARKVIEIAETGVRDPKRLWALTLRALNRARSTSPP